MNSAADMRRFHEQTALQKAKDKVIDALKNDPLGLSANQLMTVCRLSIKTVKNILATIDVQEEHGVYFLSVWLEQKFQLSHKQKKSHLWHRERCMMQFCSICMTFLQA